MKSDLTLNNFGYVRDTPADRPGKFSATDAPCRVVLLSARGNAEFSAPITALANDNIHIHVCRTVNEVRQWLGSNEAVALLYDADFSKLGPKVVERQMGRLLTDFPALRVIALTPSRIPLTPALRTLVQRGWLHDFHALPIDRKRLVYLLRHIQGLAALESLLVEGTSSRAAGFGHMIGRSEPMQRVYETIRRVSKISIPLLITGESGTGKELIAKTIHERSGRPEGAFVAINCAALPPALIESELFGHEAGSFTSAHKRKRGRIEEAHDGTLFLDEIGDMLLELQPHFLRFLQDGVFKRVGGTEMLRVRTRIIAATNADLRIVMKDGAFRDDLYYRLNGVTIEAPPLRERDGDIELLANHYLRKFSKEYMRPRMTFSRGSLIAMANHPWPGNVRELMTTVGRAVALAPRTNIRPVDLGLGNGEQGPEGATTTLAEAREKFDRKIISTSLARNQHNVQRTAHELGISRVALYRLMKRHGVTRPNQGGQE